MSWDNFFRQAMQKGFIKLQKLTETDQWCKKLMICESCDREAPSYVVSYKNVWEKSWYGKRKEYGKFL